MKFHCAMCIGVSVPLSAIWWYLATGNWYPISEKRYWVSENQYQAYGIVSVCLNFKLISERCILYEVNLLKKRYKIMLSENFRVVLSSHNNLSGRCNCLQHLITARNDSERL